ncbi:MAG: hypothetical protein GKR93_18625 [Gammaproteobacteria bacterium]|nr:hypothetical protein [Gammaproteobacteria bacterium]
MSSRPICLPKLLATSVVRGSQQGDSHGGVYKIDFTSQEVVQEIDWNTTDIDFTGRGWDRGLRGIEYSQQDIYIAASDELFVFNSLFELQSSYRNPFLKHAHEICRKNNLLYVTSTGYDSLLVFDVQKKMFIWGLYISKNSEGWLGQAFNPNSENGPSFNNNYHINSVHVDDTGIYLSGLHTDALLHIDKNIMLSEFCSLPSGVHNVRLYKEGVLFNDTKADCVRYAGRDGSERVFKIPKYKEAEIVNAGIDDSKVARQGFSRGLCPLNDGLIAAGSSPSTISVYDFDSSELVSSVNLTMDIRNAIHGLEVWPFKKQ